MPYIGKSPTGSGVRQRFHFTATGGETSLSGADDNSKTLKFTDGEFLDVYLNGVLLVQGTDYGVGTTNTISSLAALSAGDIVEIIVYDIFNVAKINSEAVRARHYYTATGSETSIGTAQIAGLSFAANADIDVSLNGVTLVAGTDYNTTTANTVGGLSALSAGNVVEIVIYEKFQLADVLSKAAGGNIGGALGVGTIKEATGTTTAMTIDSTGRILTPARPAFHITRSANISLTEGNDHQIYPFDTVQFDIGGGYNTTNFNYVCPVDGVYFFSLNPRIDVATQGSSQYIRTAIYKGTDAATQTAPWNQPGSVLHGITGENASDFESMNVSGVLQCNAGDIVTPMGGHNTDTAITLHSQSQFTGFLVG